MAQSHHAAKKLTAAHCRIAEPFFARRHVGHDTAPRSDDGSLADPHIVRQTHLPSQDDTILDHDAAGDAALGNDDAVAADRYIVSDLDQVVDLGAFADHRVAIGAAIDRRPSADLHFVLNNDPTNLHDLAVAACPHEIAESILPDRAAGMDDHAISYQAVRNRHVGTDGAVAADAHAGSDCGTCVDDRARSDLGPRTDDGAGINGHAVFHAGAGMDEGTNRGTARLE